MTDDTTDITEYQSQLAEVETLLEETPNDEGLMKLKSDLMELIQLTGEGGGGEDGIDTKSGTYTEDEEEEGPQEDSKPSPDDHIPTSTTTSTTTTTTTATIIDNPSSSPPPTDNQPPSSETTNTTNTTTTKQRTKKSKTSSSSSKTNALLNATFEIPPDLLPLPSDTDAVRSKKRRKIKALKSSFRSKQKSAESEVKQKSWLEFTGGGKGGKGGIGGGGGGGGGGGSGSGTNKKKKKKRKKGIVGDGIGSNSIFRTEDGIGAKVGVISGSVSVGGLQREGRHGSVGSGGTMKRSRHTF